MKYILFVNGERGLFILKKLLGIKHYKLQQVIYCNIKINASSPSIQRILNLSDDFWIKGDIKRTNSELERALRLSKTESAVYLRLAHLRLEQDLLIESKSFSSRGLMNTTTSSWEKFLLNIYQELE